MWDVSPVTHPWKAARRKWPSLPSPPKAERDQNAWHPECQQHPKNHMGFTDVMGPDSCAGYHTVNSHPFLFSMGESNMTQAS